MASPMLGNCARNSGLPCAPPDAQTGLSDHDRAVVGTGKGKDKGRLERKGRANSSSPPDHRGIVRDRCTGRMSSTQAKWIIAVQSPSAGYGRVNGASGLHTTAVLPTVVADTPL